MSYNKSNKIKLGAAKDTSAKRCDMNKHSSNSIQHYPRLLIKLIKIYNY